LSAPQADPDHQEKMVYRDQEECLDNLANEVLVVAKDHLDPWVLLEERVTLVKRETRVKQALDCQVAQDLQESKGNRVSQDMVPTVATEHVVRQGLLDRQVLSGHREL